MAFGYVGAGAVVRAINASLTAVAPSYSAGNTLLLFAGEFFGSGLCSTPAGWTLLSKDGNAKQIKCFGLDALGGDTIPALSWSGSFPDAWAVVIAISGCAPVASAVDVSNDRQSNSTSSIVGSSTTVTPTANNEMGWFFGARNKTSTSDGATFSAPAGYTIAVQSTSAGARPALCVGYSIQTTATAFTFNSSYTGALADGATQTNQSCVVFLKPALVVTTPQRGLLGVGN